MHSILYPQNRARRAIKPALSGSGEFAEPGRFRPSDRHFAGRVIYRNRTYGPPEPGQPLNFYRPRQ